ncbi:hypothetical protein IMSAGC006_02222 [Muribaculaceae bacterium]|nr:hypothetical protein IMSAGC006_02222 [Muribaculaceae bacterium]
MRLGPVDESSAATLEVGQVSYKRIKLTGPEHLFCFGDIVYGLESITEFSQCLRVIGNALIRRAVQQYFLHPVAV